MVLDDIFMNTIISGELLKSLLTDEHIFITLIEKNKHITLGECKNPLQVKSNGQFDYRTGNIVGLKEHVKTDLQYNKKYSIFYNKSHRYIDKKLMFDNYCFCEIDVYDDSEIYCDKSGFMMGHIFIKEKKSIKELPYWKDDAFKRYVQKKIPELYNYVFNEQSKILVDDVISNYKIVENKCLTCSEQIEFMVACPKSIKYMNKPSNITILNALKQNPQILKYIEKYNDDMLIIASGNDPHNFDLSNNSIESKREIIKTLVSIRGNLISYFENGLITNDICIAAVENEPTCIEHIGQINKKFITHKICKLVIEKDKHIVSKLKNPPTLLLLYASKKNNKLLKKKHLSFEQYMACIHLNPDCIEYLGHDKEMYNKCFIEMRKIMASVKS
jgi:hypothetical protein